MRSRYFEEREREAEEREQEQKQFNEVIANKGVEIAKLKAQLEAQYKEDDLLESKLKSQEEKHLKKISDLKFQIKELEAQINNLKKPKGKTYELIAVRVNPEIKKHLFEISNGNASRVIRELLKQYLAEYYIDKTNQPQ